MKEYFPLFVDISEWKILVFGGGKIAARRVKILLQFGKNITVAAPEICADLEDLRQKKKIIWIQKAYCKELLSGADMVLAATDCRETNREIVSACHELEREEQRKIMVNTADDKSLCDFFFPSVVRKEEITIGINSAGKDCQKVKMTRKEIEKLIQAESLYQKEEQL